jgi:plastocyanin
MLGCLAAPARFAAPVYAGSLPPFTLDVLEGYLWSSSDIFLAPGQKIVITNRDVARHTFTVDEWNIDVSLPSLIPVKVVVPETAEPGEQVTFYSSIPGDQDGGLTGRITVVTEQEIIAGQSLDPNLGPSEPESRVRIEARDDFTFQPAISSVGRGTLVEVVNTGVITHHFVVDAWGVNQTISPGSMVLVRVPDDVRVGSSVDFYCSIPGHQQQGMVGVLRITGIAGDLGTTVQTTAGKPEAVIDMRSFLPESEDLGQDWEKLRSGTSESILGSREMHPDVFPYSGIGAVYVGPNGARVTIVVLPLRTDAIPVNQVSNAVREVQDSMAGTWTIDRIASAAWRSVAPPNGCTVSERVSGIVPIVTLPGGVTSCQLTGVGVVLFVAVEGKYDTEVGVEASDLIVGRIVGGEYVARRVVE